MPDDNVAITRSSDLCVSCGICAAVCPVSAVSLELSKGQFQPLVSGRCTHCGICLDVCPGHAVWPEEYSASSDPLALQTQNCLESYTLYARDPVLRMNSTSGGAVSGLVGGLIAKGLYDCAFLLPDTGLASGAELIAMDKREDILKAAGSKYVPVSARRVIAELLKKKNRRFIVVGTGCVVSGIKKAVKRLNLGEDKCLFIGLFCDKTMNLNFLRWFERGGEKIKSMRFRDKSRCGWPGDLKIVYDSGKSEELPAARRMCLKPFFQLNRCLFCIDKLNIHSDISAGDCYIKTRASAMGSSSLIIRTAKGKRAFNEVCGEFVLIPESMRTIALSQSLAQKENNLSFIRMLVSRGGTLRQGRSLKRLQRKIKLGQRAAFAAIGRELLLARAGNTVVSALRKALSAVNQCLSLCAFSVKSFSPAGEKAYGKAWQGKNIILVGGELFNKGAQAMTFSVVNMLKERYPGKSVILFSGRDYERPEEEKGLYSFQVKPWDSETRKNILGISLKGMFSADKRRTARELTALIKDCFCFLDISGYALSSDWGMSASLSYLYNIAVARKFGVDYHILPQSIGPFDYPLHQKVFLLPLLKRYLGYPRQILVREEQGLKDLRPFARKNVLRCLDIVLLNEGYKPENIYKKSPVQHSLRLETPAIGVLPNKRIFERADPCLLLDCYRLLIESLTARFRVYILGHSPEDMEICYRIKRHCAEEQRIKVISEEMNCIDFDSLVSRFSFVIASRYHSIVHAYRNGVPAVVMGWAGKYDELSSLFSQTRYFFDCRQPIEAKKVKQAAMGLAENHPAEKARILSVLARIRLDNRFELNL